MWSYPLDQNSLACGAVNGTCSVSSSTEACIRSSYPFRWVPPYIHSYPLRGHRWRGYNGTISRRNDHQGPRPSTSNERGADCCCSSTRQGARTASAVRALMGGLWRKHSPSDWTSLANAGPSAGDHATRTRTHGRHPHPKTVLRPRRRIPHSSSRLHPRPQS